MTSRSILLVDDDANLREVLTMPLLLARVLATLALEHDHLVAAAVTDHLSRDGRALDDGRADLDFLLAVAGQEDLVEHHGATGLDVQAGDPEAGAGLGPELLSARLKNRVHARLSTVGGRDVRRYSLQMSTDPQNRSRRGRPVRVRHFDRASRPVRIDLSRRSHSAIDNPTRA